MDDNAFYKLFQITSQGLAELPLELLSPFDTQLVSSGAPFATVEKPVSDFLPLQPGP